MSSAGRSSTAAAAARGDVRAVREPQQPEGAGLGRFQLAVAQFEGGLDGQVAGLEFVQAASLVRQLGRQHRHRPRAPGGQPRRRDADRQRQEAARPDHVQRRLPLRGNPLRADDLREEGQRLLRGHHVQVDQMRPREAPPSAPATSPAPRSRPYRAAAGAPVRRPGRCRGGRGRGGRPGRSGTGRPAPPGSPVRPSRPYPGHAGRSPVPSPVPPPARPHPGGRRTTARRGRRPAPGGRRAPPGSSCRRRRCRPARRPPSRGPCSPRRRRRTVRGSARGRRTPGR